MRLFADMLRPFEHHVLEQVREAGPSRSLLDRSHVIPDVHRHDGQLVILVQQDLEPVGELVALIFDLRSTGRSLSLALRR